MQTLARTLGLCSIRRFSVAGLALYPQGKRSSSEWGAAPTILRRLSITPSARRKGFTAREGIRTGTQGARGDAYRIAYEQPINYADPRGQAIEQVIKTRVPQSAINEANALMRVEGASSKQILARVADDGTVTFEQLPDVQQLDYITRGLNEAAKKGEAAGAMGGQTALGRAYEGLSREIRSTLRDLVPEYGQALDVAADAIGQSKAVELGSKALSRRWPAISLQKPFRVCQRQSAAAWRKASVLRLMRRSPTLPALCRTATWILARQSRAS
ncbi:hypothetical protein [Sinorhizobium psoraleae]|uniref:Uncharacterized protein n=1 Tax=Sinorhizobium psoraleae TaxID=520838 RepID=A0ABT4KBV5_9HYPH|nr:hypothetical protein [Sinorhizobium psoraleae]MCZ4089323.1 hypothetical protein [Sinorhizobium psoraleae]